MYIAGDLLERGARVCAFDPAAIENARIEFQDRLEFGRDAYQVIARADAVVLATQWAEFQDLDWAKVRRLMRGSWVLDGRNMWNPSVVRAAGLSYIGVGR
jgi:UDPglucose 6-dehydrogenase